MEIRHLKLIKGIVEEGSITKTIDKLHLTQSALSHQLKEAEQQLGTKLFLRVNKKLVLTKAGEMIYKLAIDVLSKIEETKLEIQQLLNGIFGEIRISTECYTSYHWLPSLMRQFHLLYPNVELKIIMEATHYPIQKLLSGVLDVAITSDPITDDNILYENLFEDEMVAVVSSNHSWSSKKYIDAKDFINENLIIHSLPLETVSIHQFILAPQKVSPKKITVLPLTEAAVEMVKAEMGIMVMSKWAVKPYLQNDLLKTISIGKAGLKRMHFLATLKKKEKPEYFNRFIEFLQNEISM